ncbi:MAG: hypothetical protein A4E48_01743 [Methanosaeta sp. PtaU1.Bin060]|jgi:hypothetical protein|nr:MAG: hypothetical protein A4E48_01743 [Methanosaeta sp. PtaU1.Bin060]
MLFKGCSPKTHVMNCIRLCVRRLSRRWQLVLEKRAAATVALLLLLFLVWGTTGFAQNNSSSDDSLSSISANQSNGSFSGPYNVHVYITNRDDDSLEISLFIDSELMETKRISSDSEEKFDSYPLARGQHSFKITWYDEDVKRPLEFESAEDIQGETSVNLYAELNDKPEKFDLSIQVCNENSKDLDAYLYVDGSFEKDKEVSKEETSDFGSISLEEGEHNLSLRWRDMDTMIEYEKKKKITITKDDVIVFYLPAGISFDAVKSASGSASISNEERQASAIEETADEESTDEDSTNDEIETESETENNTTIVASSDSASSSYDMQSSVSSYPASSPSSDNTNVRSSDIMNDGNNILIYAGVLIIAVYLFFRH